MSRIILASLFILQSGTAFADACSIARAQCDVKNSACVASANGQIAGPGDTEREVAGRTATLMMGCNATDASCRASASASCGGNVGGTQNNVSANDPNNNTAQAALAGNAGTSEDTMNGTNTKYKTVMYAATGATGGAAAYLFHVCAVASADWDASTASWSCPMATAASTAALTELQAAMSADGSTPAISKTAGGAAGGGSGGTTGGSSGGTTGGTTTTGTGDPTWVPGKTISRTTGTGTGGSTGGSSGGGTGGTDTGSTTGGTGSYGHNPSAYSGPQEILNDLADKGYSIDPGTGNINTPNGPVSPKSLSSPSAMASAGFSPAAIAEASKALEAIKKLNTSDIGSGEAIAGGGGANPWGNSSKGSTNNNDNLKNLLARLGKNGRDPASSAGTPALAKYVGGEPIGIASGNIFETIHARYDSLHKGGKFMNP